MESPVFGISVAVVLVFISSLIFIFVCLVCSRPNLRKKIFQRSIRSKSFTVRPLPSIPREDGTTVASGSKKTKKSLEDPSLVGAHGLFRSLSRKRYISKKKHLSRKRTLGSKKHAVSRKTERRKTRDKAKEPRDSRKQTHSKKKGDLKNLNGDTVPTRETNSTNKEKRGDSNKDRIAQVETNKSTNFRCRSESEGRHRERSSNISKTNCEPLSKADGNDENDILRSQSEPYLTILDDDPVIPNVSTGAYDIAETAYDHKIFRRDTSVLNDFPMANARSGHVDQASG